MKNLQSGSSAKSPTEALALAKIVLRRWGLLASVVGFIIAGGGIALTIWRWEPSYEAKQFVRVIQDREFTDVDDDNSRNKADPKSIMATVKNEPLLNKLLLNENIRKRPDIDLEKLKEIVRFEAGGGEQYAIICRDMSPEFAAYVTQKLGDEFVDYHRQWRDQNLGARARDIESEIKDAQLRLVEIKDELVEKNDQRVNASSVEAKPSDPDGSFYRELLIRRQDRLSEKNLLKLELDQLNRSLENVETDFDEETIVLTVNSAPAILAIESDIQKLKMDREEFFRQGPKHPNIANIDKQISSLQESRKTNFDRLLFTYKSSQIAESKRTIEATIDEKNANIERIDTVVAELESEVTRLESEFQETNKIEFEYQQLLREQEWAVNDLDKWKQYRDVNKSKDMAAYQVVIEGTGVVAIPTKPVEQYPLKILGIVIVISLALPFAAAFALEIRWRRISSSDQFKHLVPTGFLGEIADLPMQNGRASVVGSKRDIRQLRIYEESVDNLSAILAVAAQQKPFVFSVTSAASNEGKTTLATQLAISAARSNFGRTLLIDADLRSPSLHRLLGGSLDVGLGDVLSNTVTLDNAITSTAIENLDLLTAGKLRTNPRRYFSNDQWSKILEQARQKYDHIIVDTPPVLAASESLEISRQCDNTLMCVMRDVSRSDSVKRAHDRLIAADVNVVGCAFSGVPQNEYAYRYGSYDYNM